MKNHAIKYTIMFVTVAVLVFFGGVFLYNFTNSVKDYQDASTEYQLGTRKDKPNKAAYLKVRKSFFTDTGGAKVTFSIACCSLTAATVVLLRTVSNDKKTDAKDIEGKDRWATKREIIHNSDFCAVDDRALEEAIKTGPIIARFGHKYVLDTSTTHSLIIGTTRSGKTQTYVLPMIRFMCSGKEKQSFIINDVKGELLENCYDMLWQNGYEIVVLNLRQTDRSSLWNPLTFIMQKYKQAVENNLDFSKVNDYIDVMAEVLTQNDKSDPIWPASAKSLFTAMILYLIEQGYKNNCMDKVNLYSVFQFFIEYGNPEAEAKNGMQVTTSKLDKLFEKLPRGNPAKAAYATSRFAEGDMKSSIFATLSENISIFGKDQGIAALTSGDDIDFIKLFNGDKPAAIFMVIPDNRPARHCIASMFISQSYLALNEYLEENDISSLPRTVNYVLDEFANMVTIPDMSSKITVSASRNILFHLFIQSLSQLEEKYGKSSKTIQENCGNLVYIYSLDPDTNKYISSILGTETLEYATFSGNEDEGLRHKSMQYKGHSLMSPTELSVLQYGETIIKRQRMYPIKTKLNFFYKLGIKKTMIKDIPLSDHKRVLSDWIFPFDIIDKQLTSRPAAPPPRAIGVPDVSLGSSETFAQRKKDSGDSLKNRNLSITDIAILKADEVTNGEFSTLLRQKNQKELTTLLNQLKIRKSLPDNVIDVLKEYIKQ